MDARHDDSLQGCHDCALDTASSYLTVTRRDTSVRVSVSNRTWSARTSTGAMPFAAAGTSSSSLHGEDADDALESCSAASGRARTGGEQQAWQRWRAVRRAELTRYARAPRPPSSRQGSPAQRSALADGERRLGDRCNVEALSGDVEVAAGRRSGPTDVIALQVRSKSEHEL